MNVASISAQNIFFRGLAGYILSATAKLVLQTGAKILVYQHITMTLSIVLVVIKAVMTSITNWLVGYSADQNILVNCVSHRGSRILGLRLTFSAVRKVVEYWNVISLGSGLRKRFSSYLRGSCYHRSKLNC